MAEDTSSTPQEPAEVWCSECDQPATGEVDGRSYCERDMGVAVRAVAARRDTIDGLLPRLVSGVATRLYLNGGASSQASAKLNAKAITEQMAAIMLPRSESFPVQNPSPEAEREAADAGIPAL